MKADALELVERTLDEVLPRTEECPTILHEAMRYAVGTGGKRIRPLICLASAKAVGGDISAAKYAAAAIELLHNYTLIHDDLPAMDNDEERRGKPTVWKKFGEANAILAGDALLALAYGVAAKVPRNVEKVISVLADRGVGVVRGQVADLARDTSTADFIYQHKTADLFEAAAVMGGLAGGGSEEEIAALEEFARNLGLAFQYEDDLIDNDGMYPRVETEKRVIATTEAAIVALGKLKGDTSTLVEISRKLVGRNK